MSEFRRACVSLVVGFAVIRVFSAVSVYAMSAEGTLGRPFFKPPIPPATAPLGPMQPGGMMRVQAPGGSVQVDSEKGVLHVESAEGSVRVDAKDRSLNVDSPKGSVRIQLPGDAPRPDSPEGAKIHSADSAARLDSSDGPKRMDSPDGSTRPGWLAQDTRLADDGVYRLREVIGPFASIQECRQQQPLVEDQLVNEYVEQYATQVLGLAPRKEPWRFSATSPGLRSGLVIRSWSEQKEFSVGPMWQTHLQLEFNRDAQAAVADLIRQSLVERRLYLAGGVSGLLLGALGLAFGCLKIDTMNRGYYSRALAVTGSAGVLGLLAAGVYVVRSCWQ